MTVVLLTVWSTILAIALLSTPPIQKSVDFKISTVVNMAALTAQTLQELVCSIPILLNAMPTQIIRGHKPFRTNGTLTSRVALDLITCSALIRK